MNILLNRADITTKISIDAMMTESSDEADIAYINKKLARLARFSYRVADVMRKARLASFE